MAPPTVSKPAASMLGNSLDDVRPTMARAALTSQRASIALTAIVKDALIRHYGSLKAAAITMQIDAGQLTRELQTGDFKLKRLERDEEAKVFVAHALQEALGPVDSKASIRRILRDVRQKLDELAEVAS